MTNPTPAEPVEEEGGPSFPNECCPRRDCCTCRTRSPSLREAAQAVLAYYDALKRPHDPGEVTVLDALENALSTNPNPPGDSQ